MLTLFIRLAYVCLELPGRDVAIEAELLIVCRPDASSTEAPIVAERVLASERCHCGIAVLDSLASASVHHSPPYEHTSHGLPPGRRPRERSCTARPA